MTLLAASSSVEQKTGVFLFDREQGTSALSMREKAVKVLAPLSPLYRTACALRTRKLEFYFTPILSCATLSLMSQILFRPQAADSALLDLAEILLNQQGCTARRRGKSTLEVWETNIAEHYLLTLRTRQQALDVLRLDIV